MSAIQDSIKELFTNGFTNFSLHSRITATDVTNPHDVVLTDSKLFTNSAADEWQIDNFEGYKTLIFTITGAAADTFEVKFGYDTLTPPTLVSNAIRMLDITTATAAGDYAVVTANTKTYMITNICAKSIYFNRTGGANTPTITYAARKS